jgi:hypothetical protein
MYPLGRRARVGLALGLSVFLPLQAQAGDLRTATIAAGVAAGADWASTYHSLTHFQVREVNPMLRPIDHRPGAMISLGAAVDAGLMSAWNLSVGRKNQRVALGGLWAMTAFRAYLALHNLRNEKRAARR